jgi:hypothetical protein
VIEATYSWDDICGCEIKSERIEIIYVLGAEIRIVPLVTQANEVAVRKIGRVHQFAIEVVVQHYDREKDE